MPEYALKLSERELARYRTMAEAAAQTEKDLWAAAGIAEGAVVADVGCGPGAVSVVLAGHVGPGGRVLAVDGIHMRWRRPAPPPLGSARTMSRSRWAGPTTPASLPPVPTSS